MPRKTKKSAMPEAARGNKWPVSQEPPTEETPPKPAPPRPKIVARKFYDTEYLGRLDNMRKKLFELDAARFEDRKKAGWDEWKDMLTAAFGYWIGYPMFLEIVGHDWHADGTRTAYYWALNRVHNEATRVLMEEAERQGLDPHHLYECGRAVQEIYADAPAKYYAGRYDTWPECMGTARYALPQGQQDALRAGEAVFVRLASKAGVVGKKNMGEIARRVVGRRGRRKLSSKENSARLGTLERWQQASEVGITRKKFCTDEGITVQKLQNIQDWQRQRENRL